MAYVRNTWVDNSAPAISAANLNNMEVGIVNAVDRTDMTTKGDLLVATASGAYSRLGVGANDTVPVAASGQSTGIIWQQIGNAQVAAGAAIAYSKLNLANSIVSADIVDGTIVNGDINASAAIAVSKLAAGSNGQVLQTTAGVPTWGASTGVSVYDRVTTGVDVNTSVTETSIYTKSITGNDMSTNKMLRLTALGDYLHNNVAGDTATLRVKFGGTTFFANAMIANATSAIRHPWMLDLRVVNLGATNSQMILGNISIELPSNTAPTTGIGQAGAAVTTTLAPTFGISTLGAIDTTAAQTLDVTIQWSASSANNSFRFRVGILELV